MHADVPISTLYLCADQLYIKDFYILLYDELCDFIVCMYGSLFLMWPMSHADSVMVVKN